MTNGTMMEVAWKDSPIVYCSIDILDRCNRRISKENNHGNVVIGGNYRYLATSVLHGDVAYAGVYAGKTKAQIELLIRARRDVLGSESCTLMM